MKVCEFKSRNECVAMSMISDYKLDCARVLWELFGPAKIVFINRRLNFYIWVDWGKSYKFIPLELSTQCAILPSFEF